MGTKEIQSNRQIRDISALRRDNRANFVVNSERER